MTTPDDLKARAEALKLYGLLAHWSEVKHCDWVPTLIAWEEAERQARSLERRLRNARLGQFKALADFDWQWPKRCDRAALEELMRLGFLNETGNAVLVGPNGVGKSTLARNIAYQAVIEGHTVLFTTASQMLNELAAQDRDTAIATMQGLIDYMMSAGNTQDQIDYWVDYSSNMMVLEEETLAAVIETEAILAKRQGQII